MFDPTVFENLKVVVEGAVYDHDFEGDIHVTDRKNMINMASMSRTYSVSFTLQEEAPLYTAVFMLHADVYNLAGEIMEKSFTPGCELYVKFHCPLPDIHPYCEQIERIMQTIWGKERMITQRISYEYNKRAVSYENTVTISFQKAITEDHVDDLPAVIDHMVQTLHKLKNVLEK
ncbi:MAG: hypothetical protein ACE3JP_15100 [Ectobacillus sp.]